MRPAWSGPCSPACRWAPATRSGSRPSTPSACWAPCSSGRGCRSAAEPRADDRAESSDEFEDPPRGDEGWDLYNAHVWRRDWPRFARFFSTRVFSEPHSTKHREDFVDWMLQADPERIIEAERAPEFVVPEGWETAGPGEWPPAPFLRRSAARAS